MPFNVLGINHKTAPVSLREKVAFSEDRLPAALRTLRQEAGVAEVVILSTCNRTELYWAGSASGAELSQWLERHHGNNLDLAPSLYVHQEQRAVRHAFSVASGLDSMVPRSTSCSKRPLRRPSACDPKPASAKTPCRSPPRR
jgi:glutamyl-tRNA reductase